MLSTDTAVVLTLKIKENVKIDLIKLEKYSYLHLYVKISYSTVLVIGKSLGRERERKYEK